MVLPKRKWGTGTGKRTNTGQNSVPGPAPGSSYRNPAEESFPTSFFSPSCSLSLFCCLPHNRPSIMPHHEYVVTDLRGKLGVLRVCVTTQRATRYKHSENSHLWNLLRFLNNSYSCFIGVYEFGEKWLVTIQLFGASWLGLWLLHWSDVWIWANYLRFLISRANVVGLYYVCSQSWHSSIFTSKHLNCNVATSSSTLEYGKVSLGSGTFYPKGEISI